MVERPACNQVSDMYISKYRGHIVNSFTDYFNTAPARRTEVLKAEISDILEEYGIARQ